MDTTQHNTPLSITEAQQIVDRWILSVGVRYFSPLTNMAVLAEEVGEVARIMARRYGDQSFKAGEDPDALGAELADVMWVVMALANQCGVDLDSEFRKSLAKKTDRDRLRHRNNAKLTSTPEK